MKSQIKDKNMVSKDGRRRGVLAASLMAGLLAFGQTGAQIPVTDGASIAKQIIASLTRAAEHGKTIAEWKKQYDHFQQQLTDLQNMASLNGIDMYGGLKRRDENYNVDVACPNATTSVGDIMGLLKSALAKLDLNGDALSEQSTVCVRIQKTKNAKYNEMVKLLEKMNARARELKSINDRQRGKKGQGELAGTMKSLADFNATMEVEMENSKNMMRTYDMYIETLQEDQRMLAKRALQGKPPSILGTLVQGAALEGALRTLGDRKR